MTDKKRPRVPGGDLEIALLAALWEKPDSTATVRELHHVIGEPRGIVYTTVAKVLDRLVEKRLVKRRRMEKAYVYSALVKRSETQRAMVRTVIEQIVGEDPEPAVAALIGAVHDVSPELLEQLAKELASRKARR